MLADTRLPAPLPFQPPKTQGPHFWDECPSPPPAAGCAVGGTNDFEAYVRLFSFAADVIRGRPDAVTGEVSLSASAAFVPLMPRAQTTQPHLYQRLPLS